MTPILVGVVLIVLAGWAVWLLNGQVAIYEVTPQARLEVRGGVHAISPSVGGRVARVDARLGDTVQVGDVLFALDDEDQQLALSEGLARVSDLEARIEAVAGRITAEVEAVEADREAVDAAVAEARAWRREAETRVDRSEEVVGRQQSLLDRGLATADALREARADLAAAEAEVVAKRQHTATIESDGAVRIEDRESRVAELRSGQVELRGLAEVERAAVERLRFQIEAHLIRAPVSGRIGDVAEVRVGSIVEPGTRMGEIIPDGDLHVVALFSTEAAGRFERGQPARLRFPGYSWTQFGTVAASVAAVSQEPVDGQIRLELALNQAIPTAIPMEHSLPTIVEVEVERVTPFELLLRTAGKQVERER